MYIISDSQGTRGDIGKSNGNIVMYSSIAQIEARLSFKNFGIKYVMEGEEIYTINGSNYLVEGGEFILTNDHCEGSVLIDHKSEVKGICIDISNQIMADAVSFYKRIEAEDQNLSCFFLSDEFMEKQYKTMPAKLNQHIKALHHKIQIDPYENHIFEMDFYFTLAGAIVETYIPVIKELQAVKSVKSQTKKELLKKLYDGKAFIDNQYRNDINVQQIASEACMSQFHFFRLFKDVFQISPYQYIKSKRLEYARRLLKSGQSSVSEIASEVGFNDIYSFSKAYKQFYGQAPSFEMKT